MKRPRVEAAVFAPLSRQTDVVMRRAGGCELLRGRERMHLTQPELEALVWLVETSRPALVGLDDGRGTSAAEEGAA